jgi:hypothetical protein
MPRKLFLTILECVRDYDSYFICRSDAVGKLSLTFYQKCSASICMPAYGVYGDLIDLRMRETTCLDSIYKFYKVLIAVFGEFYLREPTDADTVRLFDQRGKRISGDDWKHRLYSLGVEELSFCMTTKVHRAWRGTHCQF